MLMSVSWVLEDWSEADTNLKTELRDRRVVGEGLAQTVRSFGANHFVLVHSIAVVGNLVGSEREPHKRSHEHAP